MIRKSKCPMDYEQNAQNMKNADIVGSFTRQENSQHMGRHVVTVAKSH